MMCKSADLNTTSERRACSRLLARSEGRSACAVRRARPAFSLRSLPTSWFKPGCLLLVGRTEKRRVSSFVLPLGGRHVLATYPAKSGVWQYLRVSSRTRTGTKRAKKEIRAKSAPPTAQPVYATALRARVTPRGEIVRSLLVAGSRLLFRFGSD